MVAGYYFFSGVNRFDMTTYGLKIQKRARTLLVPYLFWNATLLLIFFLMQTMAPSLFSGKHQVVADYSWLEYLMAFWALEESFPICGPMWFVRNLMVICLLSPVIYLLLKRKNLGVVALILMFFAPSPLGATFYFSLGTWFALHCESFVAMPRRAGTWLTVPYIVLLVYTTFCRMTGGDSGMLYEQLKEIQTLTGMVLCIWLADLWCSCHEISPLARMMAESSFFVYAFHQAPLLMMDKLFVKVVPNETWILVAGYFVLPLLMAAIGVYVYWLLHRYTPWAMKVITGDR